MRNRKQIRKLLKVGEHFCIMPWIHLHVSTSANMLPCCQQVAGSEYILGNLNENSFSDLWQGNAIREFRLRMLNDEECECCKNCYMHEAANVRSLRKLSNSKYQKYLDWIVETDDLGYALNAKPIYWDIRFSNACNLKCRTCDENNSSSWYKDKEILLGKKFFFMKKEQGVINSDSLLRDLDAEILSVKEIYFAGGEPLLFQENLCILQMLDLQKRYDVNLIYNTNATLLNNKSFLQLWKKFKNVTVLLSLDGSYEIGEYLRTGIRWSNIESNLRLLVKECPHIKMIINFTVSVFNIFHLPDFHKEMVKNGFISVDELNLNILNEPKYYNIKILPELLKQHVMRNLLKHIEWIKEQKPFNKSYTDALIKRKYYVSKWVSCINYMNDEDWQNLIPQFVEYTTKIDDIRGENCLQVVPELGIIFKEDYIQ